MLLTADFIRILLPDWRMVENCPRLLMQLISSAYDTTVKPHCTRYFVEYTLLISSLQEETMTAIRVSTPKNRILRMVWLIEIMNNRVLKAGLMKLLPKSERQHRVGDDLVNALQFLCREVQML